MVLSHTFKTQIAEKLKHFLKSAVPIRNQHGLIPWEVKPEPYILNKYLYQLGYLSRNCFDWEFYRGWTGFDPMMNCSDPTEQCNHISGFGEEWAIMADETESGVGCWTLSTGIFLDFRDSPHLTGLATYLEKKYCCVFQGQVSQARIKQFAREGGPRKSSAPKCFIGAHPEANLRWFHWTGWRTL